MKTTCKRSFFQQWRVMLILAFLGIGVTQALAANRTFTVKVNNANYGKAQYRKGTSGSFTDMPSNNQISVADGTVLYLKAVPVSHCTFNKWSGKSSSTTATIHFTVSSSTAGTYTANFNIEEDYHVLTISASPAAGGTLTGTSSGIVKYETMCTVIATPNTGYSFLSWSVDNVEVSCSLVGGLF